MPEDTPEDQMTQEEYYRGMVEAMAEQDVAKHVDGWLNDLLIPGAHTYTTNGSSTQDFSLENLLAVKERLKPLAEAHRKNEELIAEELEKLKQHPGFEKWFATLPVESHQMLLGQSLSPIRIPKEH